MSINFCIWATCIYISVCICVHVLLSICLQNNIPEYFFSWPIGWTCFRSLRARTKCWRQILKHWSKLVHVRTGTMSGWVSWENHWNQEIALLSLKNRFEHPFPKLINIARYQTYNELSFLSLYSFSGWWTGTETESWAGKNCTVLTWKPLWKSQIRCLARRDAWRRNPVIKSNSVSPVPR